MASRRNHLSLEIREPVVIGVALTRAGSPVLSRTMPAHRREQAPDGRSARRPIAGLTSEGCSWGPGHGPHDTSLRYPDGSRQAGGREPSFSRLALAFRAGASAVRWPAATPC